MTPLKTEHTNAVLNAPQEWDANTHGPCAGLPVLVHEDDGMRTFYSYWSATWTERLSVLLGRPVRLCVVGQSHPPVHLDTERH